MRFFTLIHISETEKSVHNTRVKGIADQVDLYLACADKLAASLNKSGFSLTVLTNDKRFLQKSAKNPYTVALEELSFQLQVPSGIKFYSAHFKIEVYQYLSKLADDYVALIDSDVISINQPPAAFNTAIARRLPLYYDITDQVVPAYSEKKIISDKEMIGGTPSVGLWAGGEFVAGPPSFFGKLYSEISAFLPRYFGHFSELHHQGDEMLTSIAIEKLRVNDQLPILDSGALGIITRYWNARILHTQKPLDAFAGHFLLHLPSDKRFIADLPVEQLDHFYSRYKRHRRLSKGPIFAKAMVKKILGKA